MRGWRAYCSPCSSPAAASGKANPESPTNHIRPTPCVAPFPTLLAAARRWIVPAAVAVAILAVHPPLLRADEITRRVQEELRKRNLYFGDVDGVASIQLAAALHRYQERKGFSPTGEADTDTLFSLNILQPGQTPPPRPVVAANIHAENSPPSASSPAVPPPLVSREGGPTAFTWPDIVVLRSDAARPSPSPDDAEAAATRAENALAGTGTARTHATPTPAPPPAASGTRRRPTTEEVHDFLTRYLQAGQNNDAGEEMRFYGERVAYYGEGTVDQAYIARDVARYDHRWPERRFALIEPVTISVAPDHDPDKFVVNFRYGFNVRNPRYSVGGKADNVWVVAGPEPAGWKIVSMKEERVREK